MLNYYQNISPKYRQETHYNYVGNSGFWGSDCFFLCSPLLCYRFVTTTLTAQIPAETLSQTHRVCFMLLCYRSVTTTLTAQIPTETLSQSHRVSLCSSLLCYRKANCTNPVENAIKKPQSLLFIRNFFQMRESAY